MAMDPYYQLHKLQPSLSSPRVHFCLQPVHDDVEMMAQYKSAFKPPEQKRNLTSPEGSKQVRFQSGNMNQLPGLQRSKSLSAADALARQAAGATDSATELGPFPAELQAAIFKAVQGKLSSFPLNLKTISS